MSDKFPQSRLAREREIEVRGLADQSTAKISKVFAGLSDQREKLTVDSVFGAKDSEAAAPRSPVKVEFVRRRIFQKPGSF